jgi:CRISPR-associated protein Csb2
MRWLCIEAHLLAGRYHGRSNNGRASEWPPNPHRLFQALIAAANLGFRRTEFSDAKADAFRWLEARDPPEIVTPPAYEASFVRLYVPNNDMDSVVSSDWKRSPAELRTAKDTYPHVLDGDATVRFLWPISDEEWPAAQSHAAILCEEARHLHSLGFGIDLVAGNGRILDDVGRRALPGEVHLADAAIAGGWRAPAKGSFDELVARHEAMPHRVQAARGRGLVRSVAPPAPPAIRRDVLYRSRSAPLNRPVHAFVMVDEDGNYKSFDPRQALHVAAWMRHAAHMEAKRLRLDEGFTNEYVCGHGEAAAKDYRFSYLPLPTISGYRDGRIRRVLAVEPAGPSHALAFKVMRALGNAPLIDENGEVKAELRAVDWEREKGVFERYREPSRFWGSVTPVVLPGMDDRRSRKAIALVVKALAQAGCTSPVTEVSVQAEPVFAGAEMARRYVVPKYLEAFPRVHVIITFAETVLGPLAIGGGRHLGLGVCAGVE